MNTFNSLKANVDRLWPSFTSSVPSLPQKSLPPPSCAEAALQAAPRAAPVISSTSWTSRPAAQHSLLHPHGGHLQQWMREWGPLFLFQGRPGLSQPYVPASSPMSLPGPSKYVRPPGVWAGPGIEILCDSNRHIVTITPNTHQAVQC